MVVLALGNVELEEDVADVGFDGALADDQAFGDPDVRRPLGHKAERAALAFRERASGPPPSGETRLATTCGSRAEPPLATRSALARNSPTSRTRSATATMGSGRLDLVDLAAELDLQPSDLDGQRRGVEDLGHEHRSFLRERASYDRADGCPALPDRLCGPIA